EAEVGGDREEGAERKELPPVSHLVELCPGVSTPRVREGGALKPRVVEDEVVVDEQVGAALLGERAGVVVDGGGVRDAGHVRATATDRAGAGVGDLEPPGVCDSGSERRRAHEREPGGPGEHAGPRACGPAARSGSKTWVFCGACDAA